VNSARGSVPQAIILYEAALGLGIAVGPLVGGVLGSISWRGPFFGVSVLMAVALVVTTFLLPSTPRPDSATTLADPFRALRHRGLLGVAITALLYNFGFFTLLAFTPFPLDMNAHQIGLISSVGASRWRSRRWSWRRDCSTGSGRCRRCW